MLDTKQREKRKRIMQRSIALGHCVCDPLKPCPCPVFKEHDVCECAGERLTVKIDTCDIKLTDYVRSAGCASKIGKKDLKDILSGLPEVDDPRVLVGCCAGDDAGVFQLDNDIDNPLILTVDVFAPSVDDAYTFGQIAAANSVSDIYAMGGIPLTALSVIGFPNYNLPNDIMREILRGGIDKMKEAGIAVIGGHSINDAEIKCGFAVVGKSPNNSFIRNSGAKTGNAIVLTKPLGVGIIAFAKQVGRAPEGGIEEISASMSNLNKTASELMVEYSAQAATDVTGYSLLGHLAEIVKNSHVSVELDFDAIPLFNGVDELARMDVLPGAVERNREAVEEELLDFSELSKAQENILFCPETSGGLLVFLDHEKAEQYVNELKEKGIRTASIIGHVNNSDESKIILRTSQKENYSPLKPIPKEEMEVVENVQQEEASCCCESANETIACCAKPPEDSCCSSESPVSSPADAFWDYMGSVNKPGAINLKNKKLIALALSVVTKCEPCVKVNTTAAREAGATDKEISEAVAMGIAFGGAPTAMFYNTINKKSNRNFTKIL